MSRNKEEKIEETFQKLGAHICRIADKIPDYFDGQEQENVRNLCEENLLKCCNLNAEFKHNQNLVRSTAEVLKEEANERNAKDIYNELKEEKPYENHKNHELYNQLKSVIASRQAQDEQGQSASENEDEDLQMTTVQVNTKDPFTQKEMTDPVMSKNCKHTFERASIMAMLKNKSSVRCPTPGCGWVTAAELVPNFEMKRLIEGRHATSC